MAHTPGPWKVTTHNGPRNHAISDGVTIIAHVLGGGYPLGEGWSPHSEADARLIASAPALAAENDRLRAVNAELVAALERLINYADVMAHPTGAPRWKAARAALAKARTP